MGTKRGVVDVSRPQRIQPQFPFGLGPNAPPSIWSTSLDQFESSQSLSAVGPGHRPSTSLSLGTPLAASYTLSSPMTQSTEHRQSQWQNSNNVSFIDPAIVSAVTPSQPTTHYGGPTSYQGFSNGDTQQYIPPDSSLWHCPVDVACAIRWLIKPFAILALESRLMSDLGPQGRSSDTQTR
ncbi:hypothetical protein OG21DRAFT_1243435 [Imleria badia]|nr:hypothetical protein OG21DRAFT_1243435 [Imleria badia]